MKTTTNTSSSNAATFLLTGAFGWFAYVKYQQFKNFVNSLKIDFEVLKYSRERASVLIDNLTHSNVPYPILEINIINEEKILAKSVDVKVGSLIVPNASLPITFNMQTPTTLKELENSSLAVTFSFFGFPIKRLYKIEKTQAKTTVEAAANDCSCGG